mmetsp:Transcript_3085/g.7098  ORF Transcript_3085/g.7098 Transcript_3085/m.7098 type:complete len:121 (-) Transcript_3085:34-396(-)
MGGKSEVRRAAAGSRRLRGMEYRSLLLVLAGLASISGYPSLFQCGRAITAVVSSIGGSMSGTVMQDSVRAHFKAPDSLSASEEGFERNMSGPKLLARCKVLIVEPRQVVNLGVSETEKLL